MRIPSEVYIRGQKWKIIWRDHEDDDWRAEEAWGITYHDRREIHLDHVLKHMPGKLREVWLHELIHACLPTTLREGRPRGLTHGQSGLEEKTVKILAPVLALVLNQIGWPKD